MKNKYGEMSQPAIVAAGLVAALAAFTSFSIHKIEEGNVVTFCAIIQGCRNIPCSTCLTWSHLFRTS